MLTKFGLFIPFICFITLFGCKTSEEFKGRDLTSELEDLIEPLLGANYLYGGTKPSSGLDCSGFTRYIFNKLNIELPRSSSDQAKVGTKVKLSELKSGDLMFFKQVSKIDHVAIVLSSNRTETMIAHATSSKGVILEDFKTASYWKHKFFVARRIPNL